jgi:hypothetical protein
MRFLHPEGAPVDLTKPVVRETQRALNEYVSQHLVKSSFDVNSGFTSGKKMKSMIHENREKLVKIFGSDEALRGIDDLAESLVLMGSENKPITVRELNALKSTLKKFGISPASVLSRYYSASLGKVGPVYLITDGVTRSMTGLSDKYFDQIYKEALYDLDALENILRRSSEADIADQIASTKSLVREAFKEGGKKIARAGVYAALNEHMISVYGRGLAQDVFNFNEDEGGENMDGDLLRGYLLMNDNRTGQPSRIAPSMYSNEIEDDDMSKFEQQEESAAQDVLDNTLTDVDLEQQQVDESPDDVEYVAGVVQDIFEETGLDPETGLIFAQLESSMGKFTRAPTSSAEGVFQFIDSTWESMIEKHGSKYGITMENADKFDPEQNAYMGAEFLKENAASLKRKGHEATPENLYLAHFLGAGGANRFLKGLKEKPNAPVSKSVRKSQIEANKSLFIKKGKLVTLEEFMDTVSNKVDTARGNIQSYLDTGTSNTAEA